ncbi:hypothetical protein ABTN01_19665, partial [Acinetobacter baumannii]
IWGTTTIVSPRNLTFPTAVAASPDGRRIAIADTGAGRVVVCDLHARVEQIYPQLSEPRGLRFDGERLLVCETGADRVVAIDRANGE